MTWPDVAAKFIELLDNLWVGIVVLLALWALFGGPIVVIDHKEKK